MAKPVAPLLSFSAGGQVGKSLVFSNWKGRAYVRRYVEPANPNTAEQQATRNVFTWASNVWKNAPTLARAPWASFVQGLVQDQRNAFMGRAVSTLRGETDLLEMIFSPGSKGGIAPVDISLTPGDGTIQVDFTNPSAPTGWTLQSAIAAAILSQDPATETEYLMVADEDDSTQNQVTFMGLTNDSEYTVGAWLRWLKPDGSIAYGASLLDTATPTGL